MQLVGKAWWMVADLPEQGLRHRSPSSAQNRRTLPLFPGMVQDQTEFLDTSALFYHRSVAVLQW